MLTAFFDSAPSHPPETLQAFLPSLPALIAILLLWVAPFLYYIKTRNSTTTTKPKVHHTPLHKLQTRTKSLHQCPHPSPHFSTTPLHKLQTRTKSLHQCPHPSPHFSTTPLHATQTTTKKAPAKTPKKAAANAAAPAVAVRKSPRTRSPARKRS